MAALKMVRPSPVTSRSATAAWKRMDSMLLDGLLRVAEFEELAGVRLSDVLHENVDTIGGLIPALLGRFPDVGEEVTIGRPPIACRNSGWLAGGDCAIAVTLTTSGAPCRILR